jgi:transglutaminase-like putative cysteine protease
MSLETYFRALSYAMIAAATLALMLAGGLHIVLAIVFYVAMAVAWKLEGTKWQLSERTGLVIVLLSIPLFVLDWYYQKSIGEPDGRLGVNALAHLIIFLAAVKLLQIKKNRDWVFLYLISFFSILLAAGLSLSPIFLASLTLYLLFGLSTIIAFEIQKSKQSVALSETRLLVPPDSRIFKNSSRRGKRNVEARRLPWVAVVLLVLIFVLALPLFLIAPRSGASMLSRSGAGLTNLIGFSETVSLGEIGILKKDDAVVMHVRLDELRPGQDLRWRGVALDEFNGRAWKKSAIARGATEKKNDKGLIPISTTEALDRLTGQTVFLEAIETPVLFAASRPVAIRSDFPSVWVDGEGSVQRRRLGLGRVMYKALSDLTRPDVAVLRSDDQPYPASFERYKQLPATLDPRIEARTNAIVANARARNRYDIAKAIESQLQQDYGYSLDMKATGPDPLADFLFNVKAGHCEYFSTAMAVMLRTHGIAARVVNGFLPGEYNEAAGAYTVRQSDAHSWVEVYFPESRAWVTFDPTPLAGRTDPVSQGLTAQLGKYAAAFELFWFQYVVGYDQQEQRSLATSLNTQLFSLRHSLTRAANNVSNSLAANRRVLIFGGAAVVGVLLLFLMGNRIRRFGWRRGLSLQAAQASDDHSSVVFFEKLMSLLARRGMQRDSHLTPLEFAGSLDFQAALTITRAYNRVRFGGQKLSPAELRDIERTLQELEGAQEP